MKNRIRPWRLIRILCRHSKPRLCPLNSFPAWSLALCMPRWEDPKDRWLLDRRVSCLLNMLRRKEQWYIEMKDLGRGQSQNSGSNGLNTKQQCFGVGLVLQHCQDENEFCFAFQSYVSMKCSHLTAHWVKYNLY